MWEASAKDRSTGWPRSSPIFVLRRGAVDAEPPNLLLAEDPLEIWHRRSSMTQEAEKIYESVAALPKAERAALVVKILDSITAPSGPVSEAQIFESLSRLAAADAGAIDVIEDDDAMTVPSSLVAGQTYWIGAIADPDEVITEIDGGNNATRINKQVRRRTSGC